MLLANKFIETISIIILSLLLTFVFTPINAQQPSNSISSDNKSEIEISRQQLSNAIGGRFILNVTSTQTEEEAISFVNNFYQEYSLSEEEDTIGVFLSDTGRFWISAGVEVENVCLQNLDTYKSKGIIGSDSFCSDAKEYISYFEVKNNKLNKIIGRNYFLSNDEIARRVHAQQLQESLKVEYSELIRKKSFEKIGAIYFGNSYDNGYLNICRLKVEGDEEILFVEYQNLARQHVLADGLSKATLKAANSLDDFFDALKKSRNLSEMCNLFIGYPADISTFVAGVREVTPYFNFDMGDLVTTELLFENRAISKGFDNWEELLFAREANASKFGINQLASFGIKSISDWQTLLQEIISTNYANKVNIDTALQYLEDKKLASKINSNPVKVKKKRLQDEKAIIEEKMAMAADRAAKARAEKLKSGDVSFKYYSDGSCKDNEEYDTYCASKDEFNLLCEQVGSRFLNTSPIYTIYDLALVYNNLLKRIYQNNKNSVANSKTFVWGGDCNFTFNISGMIDGAYYDKDMFCDVVTIRRNSGRFYTSGILDCYSR